MLTHRWRPAAVPLVLLGAGLLAMGAAMPASAALSASLGALPLPAVVTSHAPQTTTGRGWHVTEQASALVYGGPNRGTNIPAANLAIVSVESPTAVSGQPVVPTTSPGGPLDSARMVLHANSAYGAGTYTQGIKLSLTIPADTRAGTYTSTITTTIGSGP